MKSATTKTFATSFLTRQAAEDLVRTHGAPLYAYSESALRKQAAQALAINAPFGLTVRFYVMSHR